MGNKDVLQFKAMAFSIRIVNLNKFLIANYREYVISKQIMRSHTSIGSNVAESRQAESRADFVHKLSISNKEAAETKYWIQLLEATSYINKAQTEALISDCRELQRLLTSSINTAKARSRR